jgi:hypothetical protein
MRSRSFGVDGEGERATLWRTARLARGPEGLPEGWNDSFSCNGKRKEIF